MTGIVARFSRTNVKKGFKHKVTVRKKPNKPLRDFGFSNVDVAFLGHDPLLQALVVRLHAQELFAWEENIVADKSESTLKYETN